ncbi:MAG: 30S ribosomal protein S9 [Candidatus Pacebacteria bacterium]|nr:30S ribosomal protein S9 [Candidatus Paceibacterota bacterium]
MPRKKKAEKEEGKKKEKKEEKIQYFEGVGRRKTSVARVRIYPSLKEKDFIINEKPYQEYFKDPFCHEIIFASFKIIDRSFGFKTTVKVKGGGITGQAEAIRHGLARALVKFNPEFKKVLKRAGFLTRDPRERERKKPGLKRARRAPQWSKR